MGQTTILLIIIALLIMAFLLIAAEIFVVGGVLGALGALLLIAATALTFYFYGPTIGFILFFVSGIVALTIIILGFKWIRTTGFGKRLFLGDEMDRDKGYESADDRLEQFRGQQGVTVSELRPSGLADFDGQRVTVTTLGGFIDEGRRVEVIDIRYNQIVVREASA
jgi:membrane-bound serine protease (ClpP class)